LLPEALGMGAVAGEQLPDQLWWLLEAVLDAAAFALIAA
jgi:hypothetical protein